MTTVAEFTMAPADFPLGRVFEDRSGGTLELDRVVPSGDTVMPYFWVQDPWGTSRESWTASRDSRSSGRRS